MSDVASTTTSPGIRTGGFLANLPSGSGNALTILVAWLILIVATGLYRGDFFSHQTVLAISFTMAIVGILAVAQALVGISGGILDLSQPTALTLSAAIVAKLIDMGLPVWIAVLAGIAAGAAWGGLNAAIIVFGKLNPIIVTLGTNFIGTAVMFLVYLTIQVPLKSELVAFGREYFLGLPNIWWPMLAVVLVAGFLLPNTRYGRRTVAVGGNRAAAKARGISLKATRFGVFIVSGAIAGLAGVLFAASNGPFSPNAGANLQLPVIAGVILAGVSLSGGRGNIWLILLSVGFLSTIPTSLVFFGFSSNWQAVVQGLILVVAVAIDGWRGRRQQR